MSPPDRTELRQLIDFARETLEDAGALARAHFRRAPATEDKGDGTAYDPVTEADRAVEARVRERIRAAFPEDAILGEEAGAETGAGEAPRLWTIDPIDGTRGYLCGFVQWGMLLALSRDGLPVLGVVHQPWTGETWAGSELGARFRHGGEERPISVRPCAELAAATLATTDPFLFPEPEAQLFHALRRSVRLGRYGGDCYAYCMLAMGQIDLVVESGLSPWDVRALVPLVEAAGGYITNWRGGACSGGGQVVASGDARIHAAVLERLAPAATGPGA